MKIVDIKTKIIPSNPRSKNYPIGYSGGIASNSNGVTPDLSIYLLKEIWERNIEERTDESGNEYLYIRKPLAIGGGATMYASDGTSVPSIFDGLPLDNQTIWKNPTTGKIEVIGGAGSSFDENAMWSALSGSSDNQINKSHLTTALDGYATQNWVIENYATKSELSAVSNKLSDFLEGSDADTIINKWKELEAFLSGMAETDNLAEILETKADKKYVDSTFVTLATKQTITGEKTFSSVMNTAAIKASGAITAPSLAVSDWVTIAGIKLRKLEDGALMLEGNLALTGALTMYASNGQSFDTIYDGLPIDNDTIYWGTVDGKKVLKAKVGGEAGSVAWGNITGKPSVFPTNIANIADLHSSWDAVLKAQKPNWLTAVSIATISDLHANWDALLKAAPSAYVTRWPTISEVTNKQNLIVKLNGGTTEGTNQFTYNATGAKTINITPAGIGAAASSHNHSWSNITSGKPTTLSGYGITDAYTKTDSDSRYINASGDTMTGALNLANGVWNKAGDDVAFGDSNVAGNFCIKALNTTNAGITFFNNSGANTGSLTSAGGTLQWYGVSVALVTSNVASATKLQNKRYFWGQGFDGTTDITGIITAYNGIKLPYRQQIKTEYGFLLATGYNSESGYNDFFQVTAVGANKAARSLIGGNTGKLVWEGNQFIMTTYGGGWYMSDNEWMRSYNNKGVVCNDLWIDSRVRFGGNAEFGGNNTPNGVVFYDRTRAQRGIFAWYKDHFYMAKFENNKESTGYVAIYEDYVGVGGNLLVSGGATFYSSDIRYKSIMQQVNLSLLDITKAPSFVYHWNRSNMNQNRLNLGGSAQYTKTILPWAVEDNDNFLSMDYATVAYTFAVHTARHLLTYETRTDKKIKKLENRVKYLEKQLKKLGYEEVRTLDDQSV